MHLSVYLGTQSGVVLLFFQQDGFDLANITKLSAIITNVMNK
jgi:hypothetical protein